MDPSYYSFHSTYGDGEEFEPEVIDHLRSMTWKNAMALKLEPGDVLILDNLMCQHSRVGFEADRRLIVSLAYPTHSPPFKKMQNC